MWFQRCCNLKRRVLTIFVKLAKHGGLHWIIIEIDKFETEHKIMILTKVSLSFLLDCIFGYLCKQFGGHSNQCTVGCPEYAIFFSEPHSTSWILGAFRSLSQIWEKNWSSLTLKGEVHKKKKIKNICRNLFHSNILKSLNLIGNLMINNFAEQTNDVDLDPEKL